MTNPVVVVMRVKHRDGSKKTYHRYWCPGCDSLHQIAINPDKQENGAGWDFTGTLECPTYKPSQKTTWQTKTTSFCCHTFITNGQIKFLDDCTHDLKGKTVPLPPLPDWVIDEAKEKAPPHE